LHTRLPGISASGHYPGNMETPGPERSRIAAMIPAGVSARIRAAGFAMTGLLNQHRKP
jgi:hypothetical protein